MQISKSKQKKISILCTFKDKRLCPLYKVFSISTEQKTNLNKKKFPTLCGGDASFPLLEEGTGEVARAARKLLLLKSFLRREIVCNFWPIAKTISRAKGICSGNTPKEKTTHLLISILRLVK